MKTIGLCVGLLLLSACCLIYAIALGTPGITKSQKENEQSSNSPAKRPEDIGDFDANWVRGVMFTSDPGDITYERVRGGIQP